MGLASLCIGDGFVGSEGMSELANCMSTNETLQVCVVCGAWCLCLTLTSSPSHIFTLPPSLSPQELRAGGNNIGDQAMSPIANALRGRSTLILLQLMGCNIGDGGATTLARVLGSLRRWASVIVPIII